MIKTCHICKEFYDSEKGIEHLNECRISNQITEKYVNLDPELVTKIVEIHSMLKKLTGE